MAKYINNKVYNKGKIINIISFTICAIISIISIYNMLFSPEAKEYNTKKPVIVQILDKTNINKDSNSSKTFNHVFLIKYPNNHTDEIKVSPTIYHRYNIGEKVTFDIADSEWKINDTIDRWGFILFIFGIISCFLGFRLWIYG